MDLQIFSLILYGGCQFKVKDCDKIYNLGIKDREWCEKFLKESDEGLKSWDRFYGLYKGIVYEFNRGDYTTEEMFLQILELEDKERRKFEGLKRKFELSQKEEGIKRERIPEEARIAVWRRDEGKCVRCGSREKLEYDHIIPVSKGGSNTVRNIELLCESCNREKYSKIE